MLNSPNELTFFLLGSLSKLKMSSEKRWRQKNERKHKNKNRNKCQFFPIFFLCPFILRTFISPSNKHLRSKHTESLFMIMYFSSIDWTSFFSLSVRIRGGKKALVAFFMHSSSDRRAQKPSQTYRKMKLIRKLN